MPLEAGFPHGCGERSRNDTLFERTGRLAGCVCEGPGDLVDEQFELLPECGLQSRLEAVRSPEIVNPANARKRSGL